MLQESSDVSIGSPVLIVIIVVIGLYVVIGSCLLCWKFSSLDKVDKEIRSWFDRVPVYLPTSDLVLTEDSHARRVLIIPQLGADAEYTLPKCTKAGLWFRFSYTGAASTFDAIINTNNSGITFDGQVEWNNTTADGANTTTAPADVVAGTGVKLTLNVPESANLWIICTSSSKMHITGTTSSANTFIPAFT